MGVDVAVPEMEREHKGEEREGKDEEQQEANHRRGALVERRREGSERV